LIRKQQGDAQRLQGGCSNAKGTRCPRTRPSLSKQSQKHTYAARRPRSLDLENIPDVVFSPALQGPGSPSGADKGQAEPCLLSGLVVIALAKLPIPSRTRPISAITPMVLRLKTWESRSPPNLTSDRNLSIRGSVPCAGWSSPVRPQKATPSRTDKTKKAGSPGKTCQNCRGVEQPGSSSGS
jgi:hypothetical protein